MRINHEPDGEIRAGEWLKSARRRLQHQPLAQEQAYDTIDDAKKEAGLAAQLLLARVLNRSRSWVLAHPEASLDHAQQVALEELLARLAQGTPLAYLLGQWDFFGLEFEVSPAVLIPRPETELLVEQALAWLEHNPHRRSAADVGTGSGAIAVCLAKHNPGVRVLAADRSWDALQVARRNADRHNTASQIQFLHGDLLSAAAGPFDLVCANLPYIPRAVLNGLPVQKYEPHAALDGGEDGLRFIRALLEDAPRWLAPGGLLLLEMQYDQGESISGLARAQFPGAAVEVIADLADLPRLVKVTGKQT
jgi:release factor glutamine methyltransferase